MARNVTVNQERMIKKGVTAYLHPPFFSIVLIHLLHSFVLLLIQFAVSLSSLHFFSHILATPHTTGL